MSARVLVTGATDDIGLATARALAAALWHATRARRAPFLERAG